MSVGDFATGFTNAISSYLTGERDRVRKAEDSEIDYQRELINSLISRPDFNPAYLGRALHDLIDLGQGKTTKRKMKPGAAGFTGHTELPLSQFFQGMMDGTTPIYGPPTPAPPQPVQWQMPAGPSKAQLLGPNPSTKQIEADVLNAPVMVPPKGSFVPETAKGLASAGQQMQESVLLRPEQMGQMKGKAQASSDREVLLGKMANLNEFVQDPEDRQAAINAAMGVPATQFLGTAVKTFVSADGKEFPGTPLKSGGIYNHNTGQVESGAIPRDAAAQKLASAYQVAARALGLQPDSSTWTPQDAMKVQQWMLSDLGQRTLLTAGLRGEIQLAVGWHLPKIIQGTDAGTGQGVTAARSASQLTGGGPAMPNVSIPPMPGVGTAAPVGPPNLTTPAQPVIAPPPVNPNGARPNMTSGPTAAPNPQRPVVNPPISSEVRVQNSGGLAVAPGGGIIAPPPADLRIQAAGLQAIPTIIQEVDRVITPLNKGNRSTVSTEAGGEGASWQEGVMNRVAGMGRTGLAYMGGDDAAGSYLSAKKSFITSLSRFAGEKGVLTEGDVGRAASMLPNLGDSAWLTKEKLNRVGMFLRARMAGLPDPFMKNGVDTAFSIDNPTKPNIITPTSPAGGADGWQQSGKYRVRVKPGQ